MRPKNDVTHFLPTGGRALPGTLLFLRLTEGYTQTRLHDFVEGQRLKGPNPA